MHAAPCLEPAACTPAAAEPPKMVSWAQEEEGGPPHPHAGGECRQAAAALAVCDRGRQGARPGAGWPRPGGSVGGAWCPQRLASSTSTSTSYQPWPTAGGRWQAAGAALAPGAKAAAQAAAPAEPVLTQPGPPAVPARGSGRRSRRASKPCSSSGAEGSLFLGASSPASGSVGLWLRAVARLLQGLLLGWIVTDYH